MKYYTFKCSKNEINQLLKDKVISKSIEMKIRFENWLMVGTMNDDEQLESYIMLKYGDYLVKDNVPSRKPKMFVDYIPNKPPNFVTDKNK